jgi:hypothetical protein
LIAQQQKTGRLGNYQLPIKQYCQLNLYLCARITNQENNETHFVDVHAVFALFTGDSTNQEDCTGKDVSDNHPEDDGNHQAKDKFNC